MVQLANSGLKLVDDSKHRVAIAIAIDAHQRLRRREVRFQEEK